MAVLALDIAMSNNAEQPRTAAEEDDEPDEWYELV